MNMKGWSVDSYKEGGRTLQCYTFITVLLSIFLSLSLVDFDERFVFKPILPVASVKNVLEILEVERILQNSFDRSVCQNIKIKVQFDTIA